MAENDEKKTLNRRVKKQVKAFMKSVKEYLLAKNGHIEPSWSCSLSMLEVYYSQFLMLTEEINQLDSLVEESRYGPRPSVLLTARDKTAVRLESLMKQFGITFKSASSMDIIEPVKEESPLEKFVKNKVEKR